MRNFHVPVKLIFSIQIFTPTSPNLQSEKFTLAFRAISVDTKLQLLIHAPQAQSSHRLKCVTFSFSSFSHKWKHLRTFNLELIFFRGWKMRDKARMNVGNLVIRRLPGIFRDFEMSRRIFWIYDNWMRHKRGNYCGYQMNHQTKLESAWFMDNFMSFRLETRTN